MIERLAMYAHLGALALVSAVDVALRCLIYVIGYSHRLGPHIAKTTASAANTQAWSTNFAKSAGETIASADKRRAMPWDLADLFKMADASEKHLNGLQFGHLVQTVFPDFPLGHYARAHFADRLLQVGHHNLPKACTPQLIARNFARAEALAENLEMPEFVRRPEAAAQCTRRALQNGIPGNPALETRIITTLVERAVQHADDEVLREWLEVAEAYRAR